MREDAEIRPRSCGGCFGKTLGVPLFQEQVMRIAIVAAGFTPAEADRLRRAMASFRNPGTIHRFRDKFIDGMTERGYARDFAERCFRQIEGFGDWRTGMPLSVLTRLADADAFTTTGLNRRQAAWAVRAMSEAGPLPLFESAERDRSLRPEPALPTMSAGEHMAADYRTTGLSLKHHPVALLRRRLDERGVLSAKKLEGLPDGDRAAVAGIVLARQRPGKGIVMFVTLEDETGTANLVVFPSVYENQRRDALTARLMLCRGKVQKADGVIHVVAERVHSLNDWLDELGRARSGGSAEAAGAFVGRGRFFH